MTDDMDPKTFAGVVLDHRRVLCAVHGEPFRAEYPRGYAVFMVEAFRAYAALDGTLEEARRLSGTPDGADVPVKAMELALDIKPACCRLPRAALVAVYERCGLGVTKRCKACGRKAKGTPISAVNATYSHLCFSCVAGASETPQTTS